MGMEARGDGRHGVQLTAEQGQLLELLCRAGQEAGRVLSLLVHQKTAKMLCLVEIQGHGRLVATMAGRL